MHDANLKIQFIKPRKAALRGPVWLDKSGVTQPVQIAALRYSALGRCFMALHGCSQATPMVFDAILDLPSLVDLEMREKDTPSQGRHNE